jgi:hypothetical protein
MKPGGMHGSISAMFAACLFASCTFVKILWNDFSDIDDYKIFRNREQRPSNTVFHFAEYLNATRIPATIKADKDNEIPLADVLASNGTIAFLIIKNDTVLFENYDDGYITSVDQPVRDLFPNWKRTVFTT